MNDARLSRRELLVGIGAASLLGVLGHLGAAPRATGRGGATPALPAQVRGGPRSEAAYRVALAQPELLAGLSCYCGCERSVHPHASLRECFLRPDGSFEPHASGCEMCQDEALQAAAWAAEGAAWSEIRIRIDEQFGAIGSA